MKHRPCRGCKTPPVMLLYKSRGRMIYGCLYCKGYVAFRPARDRGVPRDEMRVARKISALFTELGL